MAPDPQVRSRYTNSDSHAAKLATTVEKKGKREGQTLITKINDKYYDLTNFKHPGGPIALALVDGRDGTELFESHHLFTKKNMLDILSSYEITQRVDIIKSSGVYDWEGTRNDPFTIELHETARRVLGQNIKATPLRCFEVFVLFLIGLSQTYFMWRGDWFSLFTFPLAWWICLVNVFHDASHFALAKDWKINSVGMNCGFMFITPYVWYHQHIIGHHSFPNIKGMDPDLYHAPRFIRHSDDLRLRVAHTW
jgi:Fatty acid desaturase/Cytochrome b5-like Heme/Steroid binding domain